jgi:hypothetical protein
LGDDAVLAVEPPPGGAFRGTHCRPIPR